MIYGNWSNWKAIAGHEGFSELATILGQDHRGGSKGVPATTLDIDAFWAIALKTALAINQPPPT
jgi:hypothetical protein